MKSFKIDLALGMLSLLLMNQATSTFDSWLWAGVAALWLVASVCNLIVEFRNRD